jgi:trans-aconitate methyltransferase
MPAQEVHTPLEGTKSEDYASCYYNEAHLGGYDDYRWDNERWREFFTMVADRIVAATRPTTVLDVGCAKGLLVQGLVVRGVDAHGIDVSTHAIENSHADVRDRLSVASATDPIAGRWSLITCVEVLEHLSPADAQLAIDNMCAASDRVLFSSSPGDFDEATHINTHQTASWAQWFAERGFFRRTDVDMGFLSPWAVLFERAETDVRALVHRYESLLTPLTGEVLEKRSALLESHRKVSALHEQIAALQEGPQEEYALTKQHAANLEAHLAAVSEEIARARHDRLTMRDHAIGMEAQIARLKADLAKTRIRANQLGKRSDRLQTKLGVERSTRQRMRGRLDELREKVAAERQRADAREREIRALKESRTWRTGRLFVAPFAVFKRSSRP